MITFCRTDGERNRNSKLSDQQAVHIVKCAANGVSYAELAALFGIDKTTVCRVVTGKTYPEATASIRKAIEC